MTQKALGRCPKYKVTPHLMVMVMGVEKPQEVFWLHQIAENIDFTSEIAQQTLFAKNFFSSSLPLAPYEINFKNQIQSCHIYYLLGDARVRVKCLSLVK